MSPLQAQMLHDHSEVVFAVDGKMHPLQLMRWEISFLLQEPVNLRWICVTTALQCCQLQVRTYVFLFQSPTHSSSIRVTWEASTETIKLRNYCGIYWWNFQRNVNNWTVKVLSESHQIILPKKLGWENNVVWFTAPNSVDPAPQINSLPNDSEDENVPFEIIRNLYPPHRIRILYG